MFNHPYTRCLLPTDKAPTSVDPSASPSAEPATPPEASQTLEERSRDHIF